MLGECDTRDMTWRAVAVAAVIITIVVYAFAERWWLGVLLVPYQVWVALAASLSWGYVAKAGA